MNADIKKPALPKNFVSRTMKPFPDRVTTSSGYVVMRNNQELYYGQSKHVARLVQHLFVGLLIV